MGGIPALLGNSIDGITLVTSHSAFATLDGNMVSEISNLFFDICRGLIGFFLFAAFGVFVFIGGGGVGLAASELATVLHWAAVGSSCLMGFHLVAVVGVGFFFK